MIVLKEILTNFNVKIPNPKICVYGIGNQFKELYKILNGRELILFDGNPEKWGLNVNNHIIHKPDDIPIYFTEDTAFIIGCVYNQYEIANSIREKYDIPENSIYMYTSFHYESNIYREELIEQNWNRILQCREQLADQESKDYYWAAINARKQRNPLLLYPNVKCKKTGEYDNVLILEKGDIIVDCGAYTGDTAAMYIERLNGECHVFAIEPFIESYKLMLKRIEENRWSKKITSFNCAVGLKKESTVIHYNRNDFAMAINIQEQSGQESQDVLVDSLDHLLRDEKVSYIKMDIEGQECLALEGARRLIQKNHPKLVISAYHKIEDFWELPEKIWNIDKQYKIYVGHAPGVSTELELYCV